MDTLVKGIPQTINLRFRSIVSFSAPPMFEVVNENEDVIANGLTLNVDPVTWACTFTIPDTYKSASGMESIIVEVYGVDINNKVVSVERTFRLIDGADDFEEIGPIYSPNIATVDSFVLDHADLVASNFSITVLDTFGTTIQSGIVPSTLVEERVINKTDVPDRFTDASFSGYRYTLTLPPLTLTTPYYGPFTLQYVVTNSTGQPDMVFRPLLPLTGSIIYGLSTLRSYLDKARLTELDPTLQFRDSELIQSLFEGANMINSYPTTTTYWTPESWPHQLRSYLQYAAAFHALNARYLAEGFNSFDFNGLSTSLNFDRKEPITYKIEELKGLLESTLKDAKATAVRTTGVGTPPTQADVGTANNIAHLGITRNPTNNFARGARTWPFWPRTY